MTDHHEPAHEEHKLAEVWQIEGPDGKMGFELRVMQVEQYRDKPISEDLWDTFVYLAVEDALMVARASQPPVTTT